MKRVALNVSRHFLFNALNNAISLCRQSPGQAAELLMALSECLIYQSDREACDIQEEIEFVEAYLKVQQFRFEGRLTVLMDIDEGLVMQVVPLCLLVLVENMFEHVLGKRKRTMTVSISLQNVNGHPVLRVEDDGGLLKGETMIQVMSGEVKSNLYELNMKMGQMGRQMTYEIEEDIRTAFYLS